ncbi:MAG: flippase-like domain-containing protein [Deltaproteobacteria bacterium]|nr:MAG: flippase-like domain-containing protein [Deltaproteobacteria bacterium]
MVSRKRITAVLVGLAVSGLFGWLLLRGVDLDAVWAAARSASLPLLAASLLTRVVSFGFATARSQLVFERIAPVSARTQLEGLVIAFVGNSVLPFRMGMLMRVAHLSRESSAPPETVLGAIGSERLVDVAILLALAFAMLPTLTARGATPTAVTGAAATLGFALLVLVLAAPRAEQLAEVLPEPVARRFIGLFTGIRALSEPRRLLSVAALSLGFWASQAAGVLLWLTAFDLPAPPWAAGAFLVLVAFGGMIPSGPAFAGPWHYFAALTASLVGADEAKAAAFALLAHFVSFVPLTLLGLAWLWTRFLTALRAASRRMDAAVSASEAPGHGGDS